MKRFIIIGVFFSCLAAGSTPAQIVSQVCRNMLCANCKTPDEQYEAFINQFTQAKVEIVYVHTSFPDPNDPFYLASKKDVDFLTGGSFYAVQADPDMFINGFESGASFSQWKANTQAAAKNNLPGTLTISASIKNGKVQVDLHVDGASGGKQVKPYAMLVESGISYTNNDANGYGNPPNNIWDNVFRAMIPGSQGGDPFVLNGPQDISLAPYDPTGKPWNLANCKIVAYLQETTAQSDSRSHQIDALGTAPIEVLSISPANSTLEASLGAPIPNPSQSFAKIPFHLATPANVKIVVCDDLGREISTIINGFVSETQSSAVFYPNNISRGIYYARMYADGSFIGMQKIVFAP